MIPLLIVEDDTALAELIATYLGRQGYAVTVIGRGDEALAAVQRLRPQLVRIYYTQLTLKTNEEAEKETSNVQKSERQ
ncbi:hypothetical protein NS201_23680, partial [Pseudomonas oryzihabitans]